MEKTTIVEWSRASFHLPPLMNHFLKKTAAAPRECAASCGHAYTQLGSFKCVHKSQDVAFCLTVAFLPPRVFRIFRPSTSNGCRLIFPYGQFRAHSPATDTPVLNNHFQ